MNSRMINRCFMSLIIFLLFIIIGNNSYNRQLPSLVVSNGMVPKYSTRVENLWSYGYVVIWYTSYHSVWGQTFSNDGTKRGSNFCVRQTNGYDMHPSISSTSNGYFFIVLVVNNNSYVDASSNNVLYAYKFDYTGSLNSSISFQSFTHIIIRTNCKRLSNGNFVALVLKSNYVISHAIFHANLYLIFGWWTIINTSYIKNRVESAALPNNRWIAVWDDNRSGDFDIYGYVFDYNGAIYFGEFNVNSYRTDNQLNPYPRGLSSGGFVVVWDSYYSNCYRVFARIFDSNFLPIAVEFQVSTIDYNDLHYPAVIYLSNGGFAVAFGNYESGTLWNIYVREYDGNGIPPAASEFICTTITSGNQMYPDITNSQINRYIVVYITDTNQIYLDNSGDFENPTCQSFTQKINKDTTTSINFSTNINSISQTVSSLRIILKSLPLVGVLKNSSDNNYLSISVPLANDIVNYQPSLTTPTTFTYISYDDSNRESSICTVTLNICYNSCLTCSQIGDSTNHSCLSCDSSYYPLSDNTSKCYTSVTVMNGYVFNSNRFDRCPANCKICSSSTACTTCNPTYYLLDTDKQCYSICPDEFFNNDSNQRCEACVSNCKTCSNVTECIICNTSFYWHYLVNKLCLLTCPNTYYNNNSVTPIRCDSCPRNCQKCENSNSCTICDTGYYLHASVDKKCYLKCPPGYFGNDSTKNCDACSSNCFSCTNSNTCTECNNNYFLYNNTCVSNCPDTYFNKISNKVCTSCTSNCKKCPDEKDCTICNSSYYVHYLIDNQCYTTCPDNYYEVTLDNIPLCDECIQNCKNCSNSTECTTCNTGYFVHYLVNKHCYTECPSQYYANILNNKCEACSSNCFKCIDNSICIICNDGSFLYNNICVTDCPDNYFNHVESKTCKNCPSNCTKCRNENDCYICNSNYYLHLIDNKCYDVCPDRFYANKITRECESCISNCLKCPDNKICSQCDVNYFLHYKENKQCYTEFKCPSGYYGEKSNYNCESCSSDCDICKNSLECTICKKDYFLFNNYCYNQCPSSFFKNYLTGKCEGCIESCYECFNSEECSNCSPGFFLSDTKKKCYEKCPRGYFGDLNTRKCVQCPNNCLSCSTSTQCITCEDDYYLHPLDYLCYNVCPDGYFGNNENKLCSPCIDNCSKCQDKYQCITCKDNYFLYPVDGTCIDSCPLEYFANKIKKLCEECPLNCDICMNTRDCIKCTLNYYLLRANYQCLLKCPVRYYENLSENVCNECHSTCDACLGPQENQCESCPLGRSLIDGKCVVTCTEKSFFSPKIYRCVRYEELISDFSLTTPNEIDIDLVNKLSLKINIEINTSFEVDSSNDVEIIWQDTFGGELQQFNRTLDLDTKKVGQGIKSFTVNLFLYKIPIKEVTKDISFRYFNLIPIIKNLTELEMEQPIILDASLSYDERDQLSDPNLENSEKNPIIYKWICPGILHKKCSNIPSSFFQLNYEDYAQYVNDNGSTFIIRLEISKDNKKNSQDFSISLRKNSGVDNFFSIIQTKKGIQNEDVVFSVAFLSNKRKYEYSEFEYYWTIPGISENSYLNTRRESSLRVKFEDVNSRVDFIQIVIKDNNTGTKYQKSFDYQTKSLPTGKCRVEPQKGISGETLFSINAENWQSDKLPLKYSFIYENAFSIPIVLKQFLTPSFKSILPSGNKFYLQVSDSSGYITSTDCELNVNKNENIENLKNQIKSPEEKFFDDELYYSNLKKPGFLSLAEEKRFQDSLDYVNDLFKNENTFIESNIEKLVSFTNIFNQLYKYLDNLNNIEKFNSVLEKISHKSDLISKDRILANIFLNVTDSNLLRYYKIDEPVNNTSVLESNSKIWNRTINSIYSTMSEGEDVVLNTILNKVTISKVSSINLYSIKLMTKNEDNLNIKRFINNRKASSTSNDKDQDCDYSLDADLCIDKSVIFGLLKTYNQSNIGISIQVMNEPIIPYLTNERLLISQNVISISLLGIKSTIDRVLQESIILNNVNFEYSAYLNLNPNTEVSKLKKDIQSSTCVMYDKDYNLSATACNSWYDYVARVVLCKCIQPGLIANLFDGALTEQSRLSQFPQNSYNIVNAYSIGVITALFTIVFFFYLIGGFKDLRDQKAGRYKLMKKFDITQELIIAYTRHGFGKKFSFLRLYIYMIKVTHPLLSIMSIHSPFYSRGIRIFDLYNSINITFLFSLIPYFLTKNNDFEEIKSERSVSNINTTAGNLSVALSKILLSFSYTIAATLASLIITNLLNAIYFENVIVIESYEKSKIMTKGLKRFYEFNAYPYRNKFYNAAKKLKVHIHLLEIYIDMKSNKNKQIYISRIKEAKNKKIQESSKKTVKNYSLINFCNEELQSIRYNIQTRKNKIYNAKFFEPPKHFYDNIEESEIKLILTQESEELKINKSSFKISKSSIRNYLGKINIFVTPYSDRSYILRENSNKIKISSFSLQFIDKRNTISVYKNIGLRSRMKIYVYIILFFSSWFFMFIMITDVYNKYEANIFKICISPLISVILVKFLVTQNIMIFVHTVLMHFFGEKVYLDNRKTMDPIKLVFEYFVPQIAQANHKAILAFNKLITAIDNSKS